MNIAKIEQETWGYTDQGEGEVLLLLHGFPLNRNMWHHQVSYFANSYRVIAPDLRGHGETIVTHGTVTMAEMAADVARLLDFLRIDQPVNLGGLSMGGYVAWEFWNQFPERLKRLLLFDTRAVADTEQVARARQMMASQVVVNGSAMAAESMLPKLIGETTKQTNPQLLETLQQTILGTDPQAIAATQRGMAIRKDMSEELSQIAVPALVVCGEQDVISPPEEMTGIAKALPLGQYVEIAHAGHLAPLEQPKAVNDAMDTFLGNEFSP